MDPSSRPAPPSAGSPPSSPRPRRRLVALVGSLGAVARRGLASALRSACVEPTMFLYMMAFMVTTVVEQAFYVHKACRVHHGLSPAVCAALHDNATLERAVQRTVSTFHQWNGIAGHLAPILLAAFFGNWSDRRGRKLPLLLALTGKLYYSAVLVLVSLVPHWGLNWIVYAASLPSALFGGDVVIFGCSFAYICDITTERQRTLRITILDAIYLSAIPLGVSLGYLLFHHAFHRSFTAMFTVNLSLVALSLAYSVVRLGWRTTANQRPFAVEMAVAAEETSRDVELNDQISPLNGTTSGTTTKVRPLEGAKTLILRPKTPDVDGCCSGHGSAAARGKPTSLWPAAALRTLRFAVVDFFDREHLAATVRTVVARRPGFGRAHLYTLLLAMVLYTFQRDEKPMMYLYTQLKFGWGVREFSRFRTFQSFAFVVVMFAGAPLLSRRLGLADPLVIAIGALAHIGGRLVYISATHGDTFFWGAAISSLGPLIAPMLRSMVSKLVGRDEQGKVFALLSVCDNAVPMFSGLLYTQLYNHTLHYQPNAIFWLTLATELAVLTLITAVYTSNLWLTYAATSRRSRQDDRPSCATAVDIEAPASAAPGQLTTAAATAAAVHDSATARGVVGVHSAATDHADDDHADDVDRADDDHADDVDHADDDHADDVIPLAQRSVARGP